jgi:ribonuclease HII
VSSLSQHLFDFTRYEDIALSRGFTKIAGIDEAGRGPLAGPVVAAACFFSSDILLEGINDSKKLSAKQRRIVFEQLISNASVIYGVAIVDHMVIDEINILQATMRAMAQAVENMSCRPDYLLVDGSSLPNIDIPSQKIIRGDSLSICIAAASIIAKETRDRIMMDYHKYWPEYGFDCHKGYGTRLHFDMLEKLGPCPIHRRTFEPVKSLSRNFYE